jgi:hypothetical protein
MATHHALDWRDEERTRPWAPEQFAYVVGMPWAIVYALSADEVVLRLPGCVSVSTSEIRRRGLRLKLPRVLRREIAIDGRGGAG